MFKLGRDKMSLPIIQTEIASVVQQHEYKNFSKDFNLIGILDFHEFHCTILRLVLRNLCHENRAKRLDINIYLALYQKMASAYKPSSGNKAIIVFKQTPGIINHGTERSDLDCVYMVKRSHK